MEDSRIINWNKERGLLDKCDLNLELKMLQEELREFMLADEPAHSLQELCDFIFVLNGTIAKFYSSPEDISKNINTFPNTHEKFLVLMAWAKDSLDYMYTIFGKRIAPGIPQGSFKALKQALDIVIECNQAKPKVKKEGKIIKGELYVSPLERIRKEVFNEPEKS